MLPHPEYKKRATLLQSKAVLLYSLTVLTVFSFFKTAPVLIPGVLGYASNINVSDLLKYTNSKREAAGVKELTINPKLTEAAKNKAAHMFKHNYWAHVAPDGTDPWSFVIAQDYDYLYAGENLAKNFNTSKDVVEAWFKSASHRENLINDKYSEVGFAAVNGVLDGYETTLVVQMFGKTRSAPAQVAVKGTDKTVAPAPAIQPEAPVPQVALIPTNLLPTHKVDIYATTKAFTLAFASFLFALFTLDIWYSTRHHILKCTGHSFAHMVFLMFAITVIFVSIIPGRII
jgi:uncharacterized protein YkwD